ncbi:MAG: hypothetical protein AB1730_06280 [Myxococcota bacterium]|jgi:hypothetical protein
MSSLVWCGSANATPSSPGGNSRSEVHTNAYGSRTSSPGGATALRHCTCAACATAIDASIDCASNTSGRTSRRGAHASPATTPTDIHATRAPARGSATRAASPPPRTA